MRLLQLSKAVFRRHRTTFVLIIALFLLLYMLIFVVVLTAVSKLSDPQSVHLSMNLRSALSGQQLDFSTVDNVTGFPYPVVPNIIHYVRFRVPELDFVGMLSIRSALVNHRPERIIVHCDPCQHTGKYWRMLMDDVGHLAPIEFSPFPEPTEIFGKPISSVYHASDIARIAVLMRYGGIFLDGDVYVVKSLKDFLKYEFSIGWPLNDNIGTQVLIAHKNARFLRLWLNSYKHYKSFMWYYNAGQLPTEDILNREPHLVHRVTEHFGVHYLFDKLYQSVWKGWEDYYTIHLLIRHRSYLDHDQTIEIFDENNTKNYPFTFGDMARRLLFNTTKTPN